MRSFLSNSIYSNMAPLFIGSTVLFVSKEPKVKEMLRTLRLSPQITLLGMLIAQSSLTRSNYNVVNNCLGNELCALVLVMEFGADGVRM